MARGGRVIIVEKISAQGSIAITTFTQGTGQTKQMKEERQGYQGITAAARRDFTLVQFTTTKLYSSSIPYSTRYNEYALLPLCTHLMIISIS